ncbi:MAG: DAK2 domain-containing protein [Clostridia bacterium]
MKITYMDGQRFYKALVAGGQGVIERQRELNRLNVFPVPDGDTGTNMAATMRSVMERTEVSSSLAETARSIADAALTGARGNSGMILAQFFQGISDAIEDAKTVTASRFVLALHQSVIRLYNTVSAPVEGTILTVMREWIASMQALVTKSNDFVQLLRESYPAAKQALAQTPDQLLVLKENGVVDAGAKGFVTLLESILKMTERGAFRQAESLLPELPQGTIHVSEPLADLSRRYCTEALLTDIMSIDEMKECCQSLGTSVQVAGSTRIARVHLHTNDPAQAIHRLRSFGRIREQKVEDMHRQFDMIHRPQARIALLTDSTCDLPQELIDRYQIHVVPLTIQADDEQYLDRLTITPNQFYRLLDESGAYPTTSQPPLKLLQQHYEKLAAHYDSIIAIHVSQELSGTYQASLQASKVVEGKAVTVINSRHLSGSLGLIVWKAAEAIEQGKDHGQVVDVISHALEQARILVSVPTLRYMVRGGRVSPLKGWLANALNLKPIVSLNEHGKSVLFGQAFSTAANRKKIFHMIRTMHEQKPIERYVLLHAHAPQLVREWEEVLDGIVGQRPAYTIDISPAIGLHAGIGAISIATIQT